MKITLKNISKIIVTLIIISPILLVLIWGMPGMGFEVPGKKLTEIYLKIGDYNIGKQKFQYNICNKEYGCLNGKIVGINTNNNKEIYIYYQNFDIYQIMNLYSTQKMI